MGLFSFLFRRKEEPPKRRRGDRGRGKWADDRMKRLEASYINYLRRTDRVKYAALMDRRVGLSPEDGEIGRLARSMQQAKELADLMGGKDKPGEGPGAWVREAIQGLGYLAQMQRPAQPDDPPVQAVVPFPQPQQQLPAAESTAPQLEPAPIEVPGNVTPMPRKPPSPVASFLIRQLEGKAPGEAASWLVSQRHGEARDLVRQLCLTPDDELVPFISSLGASRPDLVGLVAWLESRPDWVRETVGELRALTHVYPPLPAELNVGM